MRVLAGAVLALSDAFFPSPLPELLELKHVFQNLQIQH